MKAQTALIRINDRFTLKVLLQPEDQKEQDFLENAIEKDPDIGVSFENYNPKDQEVDK